MKIFKKSTIFGEFPGEFWTNIPGEKVVGDLNSPGIPGVQTLLRALYSLTFLSHLYGICSLCTYSISTYSYNIINCILFN